VLKANREAADIAKDLKKAGILAACYHAELPPAGKPFPRRSNNILERERTHHAWSNNEIQVVVATVAFGMQPSFTTVYI
jgi:superfamily II DNA helicase RecQ